jgi:hypothetical protein
VLFEVFDTKKAGTLNPKEVLGLLNTVFCMYYDEEEYPDTEELVKTLFSSLDKDNEGFLTLTQFEGALLIEPKLARCFLPSSIGVQKRPSISGIPRPLSIATEDENIFGLLPVLARDSSPEGNQSNPSVTPEAVQKIIRSRSNLLDSIPKQKRLNRIATQSSLGTVTDTSCCTIS